MQVLIWNQKRKTFTARSLKNIRSRMSKRYIYTIVNICRPLIYDINAVVRTACTNYTIWMQQVSWNTDRTLKVFIKKFASIWHSLALKRITCTSRNVLKEQTNVSTSYLFRIILLLLSCLLLLTWLQFVEELVFWIVHRFGIWTGNFKQILSILWNFGLHWSKSGHG